MAGRFDDRLVLVTGGAAGLGRAIALAFAREGAGIALLDVDPVGMADTAAEIDALERSCSTYEVDLTNEAAIHAFAAEFTARHARLHVLVNNAGLAYGEIGTAFETLSQAKWLRFLSINTLAPLLLAQALRAPLAAARGVILNQSSMAAYAPSGAYGVTKAALNAVTYGMAERFSAEGIRVNAVAPGLMETGGSKSGLTAETYQRIQSMQMLDAHGTAEDIAAMHLFLASDEARFVTGEILHCDAGHRMRGMRV